MIEIRDTEYIRTKEVDGTVISCVRAEIDCDTADDLPAVDCIQGCELIAGSIAWDISTGDFYGLGSDGTWKKQNSGGGSGTVEFFEVNITLDLEQNISISSGYDEIKSAVDSGKIINGTFTFDLSAASMENIESGIIGGFDEKPTQISADGCIALFVYPFDAPSGTGSLIFLLTPDDTMYFQAADEWIEVTPTRGGGNIIDLSNTPFAKFINSIKEEEKK